MSAFRKGVNPQRPTVDGNQPGDELLFASNSNLQSAVTRRAIFAVTDPGDLGVAAQVIGESVLDTGNDFVACDNGDCGPAGMSRSGFTLSDVKKIQAMNDTLLRVSQTAQRPTVFAQNRNSNLFPPTVTVFPTTVPLGGAVGLAGRFSVEDIDPNSVVTRYRFRDASTNPQSGYLVFQGDLVPQGTVKEIDAADVGDMFYFSGAVIASELISIQAFDGLYWSQPGVGTVFTVEPNTDPPIASGTDFSVVAYEIIDIAGFVDAFDPNGYPIEEYLFVDRTIDPVGGNLIFKGVDMPQGSWFSVAADELQFLQYRAGLYGTAETISFSARDAAAWSAVEDFVGTTTPNAADPVVTAKNTTVFRGQSIAVTEMFTFFDADPNTMKWVEFTDLGVSGSSGYFSVNGVKQTAGVPLRVNASDLLDVRYVGGSQVSSENFFVQGFDGSRLSAIAFALVETVDLPRVTTTPVLMLDALEQIRLENLLTVESTVSAQNYEIIDLNADPTSAKLIVNGIALDPHEIHVVSAIDFQNTFLQGGTDDFGRSFDEFLVRVDNGFAKSAWAGQVASTDPVNQAGVLDIGQWQYTGQTLELTYNFPSTVPQYYCTNGFPECDDNDALTNPNMRQAIREGLDIFETFFDVKYTEVASNVLADVTFMLSDSNPDAGAYAYAPGEVDNFDWRGDIWGTTSEAGLLLSNPGQFGYFTWQHENGHSLGLDHSFEGNDVLPPPMENHMFSIMSYTEAYTDPVTGLSLYPVTPMLYDVMGLVELYGANPTYRAGNTHIKPEENTYLPQVIYDSGGFDTLNLSKHVVSATINLYQGQFSSIGGVDNNFAIAWGTEIENARGGAGNDTLIGNEGNNLLFGYDGDDRIIGNGGPDFMHGMKGRDTYVIGLGDGFNLIDEMRGAGRDYIEIVLPDEYLDLEPLDGDDTLMNNLLFRRSGAGNVDLELAIKLDDLAFDGGVTIKEMGFGRNRVETLRFIDLEGEQVGPDISLLSIYEFSNTANQAFRLTDNTSPYGNLAVPV